jgi:signal transduction histidine kinase
LKIDGGNLVLSISDDGRGFTIPTNGATAIQSDDYGGNGILSMKKRASEMDGKVEILSETGKGTTVNLSLPLENFAAV